MRGQPCNELLSGPWLPSMAQALKTQLLHRRKAKTVMTVPKIPRATQQLKKDLALVFLMLTTAAAQLSSA